MGSALTQLKTAGFGPPVNVDAVDDELDGAAVAGDVILTAGNDGRWEGASICITSGTTTAARLNFFWNDWLIGSEEIPAGADQYETVFAPPGGALDIQAGNEITCAFDDGAMVGAVRSIGGYI